MGRRAGRGRPTGDGSSHHCPTHTPLTFSHSHAFPWLFSGDTPALSLWPLCLWQEDTVHLQTVLVWQQDALGVTLALQRALRNATDVRARGPR